MIVERLRAIQEQHGYIPTEELQSLSQETNIPLYRLHGVASFYPQFLLSALPKTTIHVCQDLSCRLRGAGRVLRAFEEAARDAECDAMEVHPVSCLGQCDKAPAIAVNDMILTDMVPSRLEEIITDLRHSAAPRPRRTQTTFQADHLDPYASGTSRYAALQKVNDEWSATSVIETLKSSNLRGMGGAGFPTGVKWDLVREATCRAPIPDDPEPHIRKYVICNADECEPGTFKDRLILQKAPHLVIEGMLIAMRAVGAEKGIIYIRHEYSREKALLEKELRRVKRSVGESGIVVFESPGGYICGEETALLEALEGKRAEPRNKPPFPGTHGLHQKPTLINNVETFAWIPAILLHGADWWKRFGVNGGTGLKMIALSGDVKKPGVYEVPLGTTAAELIYAYGGGLKRNRKLKAFSPGGASSGFLPASMVETPLDFRSLAAVGSMLGSGAVVAIAEGSCMLDLALNQCRFFRDESCGKCVPCRMGSEKIVQLLRNVQAGQGRAEDLELIEELNETMQLTSICGLGQVAAAPIVSALKYFREEIHAHITKRKCPAKVCFR